MSHRRTTLFVAGIGGRTRARDLAYEFESYAFVEFEDDRDAEDAYYEMQNRKVDGYPLNIQWAKNAPSRNWRYDDRRDRSRSPPRRPRGGARSRSRSPPPPRGGRDDRDRHRSRSPVRDNGRDERDVMPMDNGAIKGEHHGASKDIMSPVRRSPSPAGNGHRSPSPRREVDDHVPRSPSPRD
ncbi:hypothetical protein PhCBS80983_g01415 [Powellomyces hirtus]|uniref:RRM domain-containing protein n=1 Tax=Powellomyces hirtus TaxID=109895 RepID=A0A507EA37_9FUNG|nr:hypothetical protein DFJ77DRAFT_506254 [Powellomyces hirtus]TPX60943.1 hypothetical protein PhCBS80983_g01415 [Powellomyces hirtus]